MDLILRGGTVIDGTGQPRVAADVGIENDRIVAVDRLGEAQAAKCSTCRAWSSRPALSTFITIPTAGY